MRRARTRRQPLTWLILCCGYALFFGVAVAAVLFMAAWGDALPPKWVKALEGT